MIEVPVGLLLLTDERVLVLDGVVPVYSYSAWNMTFDDKCVEYLEKEPSTHAVTCSLTILFV